MSPAAVLHLIGTHQVSSIVVACSVLIVLLIILPVVVDVLRHVVVLFVFIGVVLFAYRTGNVSHVSDWSIASAIASLRSLIHTSIHISTSALHPESVTIPCEIFSVPVKVIVDTGSSVTLISTDVWRRLPQGPALTTTEIPRLSGINGNSLTVHGRVTLPITFSDRCIPTPVYVCSIQPDVVLGLDFLRKHDCCIQPAIDSITFPQVHPPMDLQSSAHSSSPVPSYTSCHVSLTTATTILPFSHVLPPGTLRSKPEPNGEVHVVEPPAVLSE